jgi:hypothetical protein
MLRGYTCLVGASPLSQTTRHDPQPTLHPALHGAIARVSCFYMPSLYTHTHALLSSHHLLFPSTIIPAPISSVPLVPPLSLSRSCTIWLSTSQPRGQRSRGSPNPGTLVQHPRAGSQADFKARCIYDSTLHTVDHQTTSSRNCHLSAPVSAPTLVPPLCHNTATALCTALALLIQSAVRYPPLLETRKPGVCVDR